MSSSDGGRCSQGGWIRLFLDKCAERRPRSRWVRGYRLRRSKAAWELVGGDMLDETMPMQLGDSGASRACRPRSRGERYLLGGGGWWWS